MNLSSLFKQNNVVEHGMAKESNRKYELENRSLSIPAILKTSKRCKSIDRWIFQSVIRSIHTRSKVPMNMYNGASLNRTSNIYTYTKLDCVNLLDSLLKKAGFKKGCMLQKNQ